MHPHIGVKVSCKYSISAQACIFRCTVCTIEAYPPCPPHSQGKNKINTVTVDMMPSHSVREKQTNKWMKKKFIIKQCNFPIGHTSVTSSEIHTRYWWRWVTKVIFELPWSPKAAMETLVTMVQRHGDELLLWKSVCHGADWVAINTRLLGIVTSPKMHKIAPERSLYYLLVHWMSNNREGMWLGWKHVYVFTL